MAPFLNSRQIPFFLWKLKGEKGEVLGYKQLSIKTPGAEARRSLCEPSGWKPTATLTCCISRHACVCVCEAARLQRFLFRMLTYSKSSPTVLTIKAVSCVHSRQSPGFWSFFHSVSNMQPKLPASERWGLSIPNTTPPQSPGCVILPSFHVSSAHHLVPKIIWLYLKCDFQFYFGGFQFLHTALIYPNNLSVFRGKIKK